MSTDRIHTRTAGVPSVDSPIGTMAHDPAAQKLYIKSASGVGVGAWGPGIGTSETFTLTNDEVTTITEGEAVIISSANSVSRGINNSTEGETRIIGFAAEDIIAAGSGEIFTLFGTIIENMQLITGLTPTAGDLLFLSAISGALTTIQPGAGFYSKPLGVVVDALAYVGGVKGNSLLRGAFVPEPATLMV